MVKKIVLVSLAVTAIAAPLHVFGWPEWVIGAVGTVTSALEKAKDFACSSTQRLRYATLLNGLTTVTAAAAALGCVCIKSLDKLAYYRHPWIVPCSIVPAGICALTTMAYRWLIQPAQIKAAHAADKKAFEPVLAEAKAAYELPVTAPSGPSASSGSDAHADAPASAPDDDGSGERDSASTPEPATGASAADNVNAFAAYAYAKARRHAGFLEGRCAADQTGAEVPTKAQTVELVAAYTKALGEFQATVSGAVGTKEQAEALHEAAYNLGVCEGKLGYSVLQLPKQLRVL